MRRADGLAGCLGWLFCKRERGQAIVLIAAGAVALMGMLGVVVETGHLYAEQRRMQNAADNAAMAGAQNWLNDSQQLDFTQAIADARAYAGYNGYTNSVGAGGGVWSPASNNGVVVNIPPATGPNSASSQYVEVVISQPVATFFGGIFNMTTVQVTARAVARGMSGDINAALIALDSGTSAIASSGSSTTNVYGNIYSAGGVACNSGFLQVLQGAAYAVSGFDSRCTSGGAMHADDGTYSSPPHLYDPKWNSAESQAPAGPGGNWNSSGQTVQADGYIHIPAGTYNSVSVNPGDYVKFDGGVYHLLGVGDSPALNVQGIVATAAALQFVLESGAVHFESQATGTLSSGAEYNNILIYSKQTGGGNAIQITGGASLTYNGTIYAPGGNVAIAGNSSATINGQVVAKTVSLSGNSGTAIRWDGSKAPNITAPRLAE